MGPMDSPNRVWHCPNRQQSRASSMGMGAAVGSRSYASQCRRWAEHCADIIFLSLRTAH